MCDDSEEIDTALRAGDVEGGSCGLAEGSFGVDKLTTSIGRDGGGGVTDRRTDIPFAEIFISSIARPIPA